MNKSELRNSVAHPPMAAGIVFFHRNPPFILDAEKLEKIMDNPEQKDQPALSADEANAAIEKSPKPRVTKELINGNIVGATYTPHGTLTICTIEMKNGFKFVGTAACVDPENFDAAIGQRVAYDDAFRQIWSHEGYVLANQKMAAEHAAE